MVVLMLIRATPRLPDVGCRVASAANGEGGGRKSPMARNRAGGTPATSALTRAGVPFTLHPYVHDDASATFGDEAAAALGVDPDRIFKTLLADLGGELVVAVVPVSRQLDLKALATSLGAKKATMADPGAATRSTGYVLGGISPFGQRTRLRTVVDVSAAEFSTVYVSAGKRGLQVELTPGDLLRVTEARSGPVAH
jgi:Cys-tRNA(Pro)/Cys-tRNA(Cys) deacylase